MIFSRKIFSCKRLDLRRAFFFYIAPVVSVYKSTTAFSQFQSSRIYPPPGHLPQVFHHASLVERYGTDLQKHQLIFHEFSSERKLKNCSVVGHRAIRAF